MDAAPAVHVSPQGTVVLNALAHPLIAGALSVLAFVRVRLCSLRSTRDLDITGDISVIQIHDTAHRTPVLRPVRGSGLPGRCWRPPAPITGWSPARPERAYSPRCCVPGHGICALTPRAFLSSTWLRLPESSFLQRKMHFEGRAALCQIPLVTGEVSSSVWSDGRDGGGVDERGRREAEPSFIQGGTRRMGAQWRQVHAVQCISAGGDRGRAPAPGRAGPGTGGQSVPSRRTPPGPAPPAVVTDVCPPAPTGPDRRRHRHGSDEVELAHGPHTPFRPGPATTSRPARLIAGRGRKAPGGGGTVQVVRAEYYPCEVCRSALSHRWLFHPRASGLQRPTPTLRAVSPAVAQSRGHPSREEEGNECRGGLVPGDGSA